LSDNTLFRNDHVTSITGNWVLPTETVKAYPLGFSAYVTATCTYGLNDGLTITSNPIQVILEDCGLPAKKTVVQKASYPYSPDEMIKVAFSVTDLFFNTTCRY